MAPRKVAATVKESEGPPEAVFSEWKTDLPSARRTGILIRTEDFK